jgi:enterobacterial common antigen flippase
VTLNRDLLPHETEPENTSPVREKSSDNSYSQILKSTSIVGGAQVINMAIGLIRTKLVAILIGPAGVGLVGVYQSIISLISTVAGFGIQTSGVRDIARNHGQGDMAAVAKTIVTLRRFSWLTGLAGWLLLAALSPWLSEVSFGTRDYALAISLLGLTILLGNIAGGQSAILQGTRRIGDLAKIGIWSAIASTLAAIGLYAVLGLEGVVPTLIATSAITVAVTAYYARKLQLETAKVPWKESAHDAKSLLILGLALVGSGVLIAAVGYAIRILITQTHGLEGVGIYSAAFNLSGMFVQFVLVAMGADFYPRLTAESNDHEKMSRLINEQTEIGLLLAFPGLLATIALAPFVIAVFYSAEFAPATDLLKWFIIGCMGRVLSWPLGFSLLAKGQSRLFITTEILFNAIHLLSVRFLMQNIGLLGVAVGFAIAYFLYTLGMLCVNRRTISFAWSKGVWKNLAWMIPVAAVCISLSYFLDEITSAILGSSIAIASGLACVRKLVSCLGMNDRMRIFIKRLPFGKFLFPNNEPFRQI